MNENEKYTDSPEPKSRFFAWLDNFWYHYKWHTIAALFIVFVLVLCIMQTCSRPNYDIHVMYAGGTDISRAESGGESEFRELTKAYQRFVSDFDGDGERRVNLSALFIPSKEDIKEIESRHDGTEVNYALIEDNKEIFRQSIVFGDYYIIILSESLFIECTKNESNNPFANIRDYLPDNAKIAEAAGDEGYLLAGECGVYLSSTPLYDNPGFSSLGSDSIIAIRRFTEFGTQFKGDAATEFYKHNEMVFRLMLNDEAYA
ncbi:MAG: hypothetical protein E7617_01455 [Ruminococcaceae bacterium]|nr:hypothetical protein [Oscillospiraceae bacterium]